MTAENRFCKRFIVWEKFELAEYIEGMGFAVRAIHQNQLRN